MTRYVLDNGPLGHLAAIARNEWSWPGSTLHIVDDVAREGWTGERTRRLLGFRASDGQPWITRHELVIGSAAQRMYSERLRPRSSQAIRNTGEDASIAILACEMRDAVFVTMDARASLSALIELGPGRVASPFDFWRWLAERELIDPVSLTELDRRTSKNLGLAGPPWRLAADAARGP